MRNWMQIALVLLAALLIFTVGAGAGYGVQWYLDKGQPDTQDAEKFAVYWEAWHIIEDRFYGDVPDDSTPVYGAIRGALGTLQDPYTVFVEPQPRALEKAEL